jgi:hypothetical protein
VSLDEEASLFRILTASLAAWVLSALVMRRFLSPAARAFSLPDLASGFLSASSLPSGRGCLVGLVFGFSRLAFFSRSASIRGVVLAFSCLCPSLSGAAALAMGLVRLSRKSLNSWSWSMVPWRGSLRRRPPGSFGYGANSSVGGPMRALSCHDFAASWNVAARM